MSIIEKRYAEALVDLADEENAVEAYKQGLEVVRDVFDHHEDFRFFVLNRALDAEAKKDLIQRLFSKTISNSLLRFLFLLVDKGRIRYLPGIIREFYALADKRKNLLYMKIISATPVEDTLLERIKERYGKIHHAAAVKADFEIDKRVIGGIKILIGNTVTDATLKGRLRQLEEWMTRG